ncbi:MAG: hypothetical protein ACK2TV_06925 [Anaerolineales bacterium]|jgi:hypothetical protein
MAREQEHNYNFGILNLQSTEKEIDAKQIYDSLQAKVVIGIRDFFYIIAEEDELDVEGDRFGYGVLVKYKEAYEGQFVDASSKSIHNVIVPQWIFAKSKFFIHYDSRVISYRPVVGSLSDHQFKQMFTSLFQASYQHTVGSSTNGTANVISEGLTDLDDSSLNPTVETICEVMQLQDAIDELKIVRGISYTVYPTNPGAKAAYKKLDMMLKELKAKQMSGRIKAAGEGGLDKQAIKQDEFYFYKGLQMVADGYGYATVSGIDKYDRNVQIRESTSPITKTIIDSDYTRDLIYALYPTFKRVWDIINYVRK